MEGFDSDLLTKNLKETLKSIKNWDTATKMGIL